jgi:hypothetical protein
VRKPAGDALEIGKDPVAPLVVQAAEGGTEKLAVIHCEPENEAEGGMALAFLERFQD